MSDPTIRPLRESDGLCAEWFNSMDPPRMCQWDSQPWTAILDRYGLTILFDDGLDCEEWYVDISVAPDTAEWLLAILPEKIDRDWCRARGFADVSLDPTKITGNP